MPIIANRAAAPVSGAAGLALTIRRAAAVPGARAVAALASVALCAAVLAGCGTHAPAGTASSGTAPRSARSAGRRAQCVRPRIHHRLVTLNASDSGKSLCLPTGTGVLVILRGSRTMRWSAIRSDSAVLQRRPSGVYTLMLGAVGGYFVATRVGRATLTATGLRCPAEGKGHAATSVSGAQPRCAKSRGFAVTIRVLSTS